MLSITVRRQVPGLGEVDVARTDDPALVRRVTETLIADAEMEAHTWGGIDPLSGDLRRLEATRLRRALAS